MYQQKFLITYIFQQINNKKMGHRNFIRSFGLLVMTLILMITMRSRVVEGTISFTSTWQYAHATFYGDASGQATMGGACGYGNLWNNGFQTAALSTTLFNNGKACGTCYQIKCVESKWCTAGSPIITVTATNYCPPNWYQPTDNGGWCNPPRIHFDLTQPMFVKLAVSTAGIIPVMYKRVPCQRTGGIRFSFKGNANWLLVFVMNVAGGGDVSQMWVKGSKTDWISMSPNWGASFQAFAQLQGQALSFKLSCGSTGTTIIANNVFPANWQYSYGQAYQASVNFT